MDALGALADTVALISGLFDILVAIVVVTGGIWAILKVARYRELRQRIQLEIDANVYKLSSAENVEAYTWGKEGDRQTSPVQPRTHVVEVILRFANKGFTRMKLYNIQIGINTMRPQGQAGFDSEDGHLHLTRIHTSGNIVPLFPVTGRPVEKTSYYYIEPGIEQAISYLALITEPRELIQVYAKFSLEQSRIFPKKDVGISGLYPHTAARTFAVEHEGSVRKPNQL